MIDQFNTQESLSLSTTNPLSQWTSGSTNSYVISVPSSGEQNVLSQSAQLSYDFQYFVDSSNTECYINWMSYQEQIYYSPYNPSLASNGAFKLMYESPIWSSNGTTIPFYNQNEWISLGTPTNFNLYTFDHNSSNYPYFSEYGTYKFEVVTNLNWGVLPQTYTYSPLYAEIHVVPGYGSINPPATVLVNHTATITGTVMAGSYTLGVYAPGTQPSNSQPVASWSISGSTYQSIFSKTFTPTKYGEYTIQLENGVVNQVTTQLLSVFAFLPNPIITINSATNTSGYYSINQQINYSISGSIKGFSSTNYQFQLLIWIGSAANEPSPSSSNWIQQKENVNPTQISGNNVYYNSSFNIPATAAKNVITIEVYAIQTTSKYINGSQPVIDSLNVGAKTYYQPPTNPNYFIVELEIVATMLTSIVILWVTRSYTPGMAVALVGSAGFLSLMIFLHSVVGVLL